MGGYNNKMLIIIVLPKEITSEIFLFFVIIYFKCISKFLQCTCITFVNCSLSFFVCTLGKLS